MYIFSRFTSLHCLLWWVSNVTVTCSKERSVHKRNSLPGPDQIVRSFNHTSCLAYACSLGFRCGDAG